MHLSGYPTIGSTYSIGRGENGIIIAVIANDTNNKMTLVEVVSTGDNYGKKSKVPSNKILEAEPLGLILPLSEGAEIVFEDGVQFIQTPKVEKTVRHR